MIYDLNEMLQGLKEGKSIEDLNKEFTFTLTLSDKTINGTYGDMNFENGIAEFSLKHNEVKTASSLPSGMCLEYL